MAITVLLTTCDFTPLADPLTEWANINAEAKYNEVGAGTITLPTTTTLTTAAETPGTRITLIRNNSIFSAGPVEKTTHEWSVGEGNGLTTIQWADDLSLITRRIAYPNPALDATAQDVDSYEATATNAETLIRDIVNKNVGPGALANRQHPGLTLAAAAGIGTNIDVKARFDQLGDLLRTLCVAGGDLGIRITGQPTSLVFQVYQPQDRSATVRFSAGLNNLLTIKIEHNTPIATTAIVAGAGTGTLRPVVERTDTTAENAYGRSETFVNSNGDTTTILEQAGGQTLVEKSELYTVVATAIDTPDQQFGTHFGLNDIVSIQHQGIAISDVVTAAKLTATPQNGDQVEITIGSKHVAGYTPEQLQLRELNQRLSTLERV